MEPSRANRAMRILVVEDDALLAAGLASILARASHTVFPARTAAEAMALISREALDLVILDIGLPDIDGFDVLKRIRAERGNVAVLVLTARDAVEDRVRGLDLGADDYLTKPFSIDEFEARVRALLRRSERLAARWSVGAMTVDVAAKRVRVHDKPVDVTPREWSLLELFLTRPGRVLSKEQIAENLFTADEQLSPNAIEVHVSRLRSKIESAGVHIRTVRGFGYMLEPGDG
ncbi:MAG TPA: response regulator transcription factor [Casimicrobiaceae bacterium]|jgi:two-component system OmpR family response regulator